MHGEAFCAAWAFAHAARSMIGVSLEYSWKWHALKFVENVLGMMFVCVVLYSDIDAEFGFVSLETRLMYRDHNERIEAMIALGWIAGVGAFLTYLYMNFHGVILASDEKRDTVFSPATPQSQNGIRVHNAVRAGRSANR